MKYYKLIPMLFLLAGCFKVTFQPSPFQYVLSGIQDISLHIDDTTVMSITVSLVSGDSPGHEPVTLLVRGLPDNITVTPDSTTFHLNNYVSFIFKSNLNAKEGTYPIQIIERNLVKGNIVHAFNLTITACRDLSQDASGDYYITTGTNCTSFTYLYVSPVYSKPYAIELTFYPLYSRSVYAYFNCGDSTFFIPAQKLDTITTISGTGKYGWKSETTYIQLDDTVTSGSSTSRCSSQFKLYQH